jgi:hypothetical protein
MITQGISTGGQSAELAVLCFADESNLAQDLDMVRL